MVGLWQVVICGSCLCFHVDTASLQVATSNLRSVSILHREDPQIHDVAEEAKDNTDTVYKRIMTAPQDIPKDAARDEEMIYDTFLPGYKPNVPVLSATFVAVMVACLWFTVYFGWLYKNDRVADDVQVVERAKELAESEQGGWLCRDRFAKDSSPDMVLVIPHPGHASHKESNDVDLPSPMVGDVFNDSKFVPHNRLAEMIKEDETPEMLNLGKVRAALMQDIHDALPGLGFQFDAFTSIDGDEIFFCISLEDEKMIEHYLIASHGELQLHPEMEGKLGVGTCQDRNAVASPWVRYERSMVEELAKYNIIDNDDPRSLFITFKGKHPQGCLLSGLEDRKSVV